MDTPKKKTVIRKETGPWTPSEYAAFYAVSRATVYNWFSKGWLGSSKIGGCRRIMPSHDVAFRDRFTAQGGSHE
jgi:hypothetical protein